MALRPHWILASALLLGGCASDTSPGQTGKNPPGPPTRTPSHLEHSPRVGVQLQSGEETEGATEKPAEPETKNPRQEEKPAEF